MAIIEDKALCRGEATKHVTHRLHDIELDLTRFGDGKVTVDGIDVSAAVASTIRLDSDHEAGPRLTVVLPDALVKAKVEGRVEVDAETAAALELLGWTPPVTDA